MTLNDLIKEMEKSMSISDISEYVDDTCIGEWKYGCSMVPCAWVYPYLKELQEKRMQ